MSTGDGWQVVSNDTRYKGDGVELERFGHAECCGSLRTACRLPDVK